MPSKHAKQRKGDQVSGGRFDYQQHAILEIADEMERAIPEGWDGEVAAKFREGIKALRIAYIHAQRADWYLSGDDGAESYLKRLAEELAEVHRDRVSRGDGRDASLLPSSHSRSPQML